ncbi:MAG: hypothetical protein COT61_02630 [Candidatus Portnoybacteria bacterium CG09_land_8_20_14_0_10_44_13]|uniref:Uncharacterized protein n=1 Tax=Candidatus Portnoybacteria bacterium CG09_land_8_20_14_0_10_44_13 TaxID=1974811 RepID=A0A2H0WVM5_9BACT|nr:MAG: hypothetical protein COT61_02630 [Candidatus Portnoybacteria bacterium CG09_land_8_20_14_0_10_44_13]
MFRIAKSLLLWIIFVDPISGRPQCLALGIQSFSPPKAEWADNLSPQPAANGARQGILKSHKVIQAPLLGNGVYKIR